LLRDLVVFDLGEQLPFRLPVTLFDDDVIIGIPVLTLRESASKMQRCGRNCLNCIRMSRESLVYERVLQHDTECTRRQRKFYRAIV
jgi:hypothetical protein